MQIQPTTQHEWLQALVGEWESEMVCVMGPDQEPIRSTGKETVRSIGGLWMVAEGIGVVPGGDGVSSIMTIGFDPAIDRFVGTFIANCMTSIWHYVGQLDPENRKLTLDTEGPSFLSTGIAKYQDSIEVVNRNHKILRSQILRKDGEWVEFMVVNYRRLGTES